MTAQNVIEISQLKKGRLISGVGSLYIACDENGKKYSLRCKNKFRHIHMSPLVGDEILFSEGEVHSSNVLCSEEEQTDGWIEEILPRKSVCLRPPVANVEMLIIVVCPSPAPDFLLVDRMIIYARMQGIQPVIAVNKCDLSSETYDDVKEQYKSADLKILSVSAASRKGLDELRQTMTGKLCCMTGQSGVGKSTLLNSLLNLNLETGEISRKIQRGKNTTRHSVLLEKDGLSVLDTAGFSLLEMCDGIAPETVKNYYPEFYQYEGTCKFASCLHNHEKGCLVCAAVENGIISPQRHARYCKILSEVKEKWDKRYD